jgi:hypothetical protein
LAKEFSCNLQNRTVTNTAPTNPGQPIISGIVFSFSAFLLLRTLKTAACLPQRRIKRRKCCTTNFHGVRCKRFSGLSTGQFISRTLILSKKVRQGRETTLYLLYFLNSSRYLTKKSVLWLLCYFFAKHCVPEHRVPDDPSLG